MTKDATQEALDPEALALSRVISALNSVDADAQRRIFRLVSDKFKLPLDSKTPIGTLRTDTPTVANSSEFTDISDLFEHARPKLGTDRALVAGYWFQVCQGKESFTGQEINDALKDLGHASNNITSDMTNLKKKSPALIQQVSKTGKAQQGRKKYKVTRAGIAAVASMLSGGSAGEEE